jgi:TorA maturation chaperone TorD
MPGDQYIRHDQLAIQTNNESPGLLLMDTYELATARRRAYYLFGRLFLDGIRVDLAALLNTVPELASAADLGDPDQVAADHYQLTAVSVFPYESIFLDPSGLLGGPICDRLSAIYGQNGYEVLSDSDHIGHELLFLSHLCAAETAALVEGDESAVSLWRSRQQAFLVTHLLRWLAPLVIAVEQSGSLFYGRLANLTLELAADHLAAKSEFAAGFTLPAPPQLGGSESSLKEIARFLVTPPYSGLFLSRDAISALARKQELPRGFGDRAQILTTLLRTAGQYDAAGAVFQDLAAICSDWAERYGEQLDRFPNLAPWIRPWQERVEQTAESLRAITAALQENEAP